LSDERGAPIVFPAELARIPENHPRLLKEEWLPVAQIHETFILAVSDRDLYIVDQHTAHERVLFERFLRLWDASKIDLQQLLIPVPLELSVPEFLLLHENLRDLHDLGLELEPFGERTFLLRSVPAIARNDDYHQLIIDILDDLRATESTRSAEERRKRIVASLACHSAVRAHRPMKNEEMRSLLSDLQATDLPYTCPHGRPTIIRLEGATLERLFWRR
jgi:DNA mismatch repair protein MutL